jgi:hypothetical protein
MYGSLSRRVSATVSASGSPPEAATGPAAPGDLGILAAAQPGEDARGSGSRRPGRASPTADLAPWRVAEQYLRDSRELDGLVGQLDLAEPDLLAERLWLILDGLYCQAGMARAGGGESSGLVRSRWALRGRSCAQAAPAHAYAHERPVVCRHRRRRHRPPAPVHPDNDQVRIGLRGASARYSALLIRTVSRPNVSTV